MERSKIRVYVVEDDPAQSRLLQGFLKLFPQVETLGSSPSAEAAFDAIMVQQPDLLFLDVDLKKASGLELAHKLRAQNVSCQIVFTTAHPQYACEAINVESMDFLVKSFGVEQIRSVIDQYEKLQISSSERERSLKLQLPTPNGALFIQLNEIAFVKTTNRGQTLILNPEGQEYIVNKTISWWEKELVNKRFFKASRSVIINLRYATFIDKKKCTCTLTVGNKNHQIEITPSQMTFFEVTDLLDFDIV